MHIEGVNVSLGNVYPVKICQVNVYGSSRSRVNECVTLLTESRTFVHSSIVENIHSSVRRVYELRLVGSLKS